MPHKIFTSNSLFVKAIVDACKYAIERNLSVPPNANPAGVRAFELNPKKIADFVTELFWASFDLEEGRPIKCEIVVVGEDAPIPALKFTQPIRFSRKKLVSLATASPRHAVALGVSDTLTLSFWGLLDVMPYGFLLRFRIASPGVLVAAIGNRTIAISSNTNELRINPDSNYPSIATNFITPMLFGTKTTLSPKESRKLSLIVYLALAVQRHGHGGALAIVPENVEGLDRLITRGYPLSSDILLSPLKRLEEFEVEEQQLLIDIGDLGQFELAERFGKILVNSQRYLEEELRSTCNRIGRLSAVDGALIITHNLKVLGFGCMFAAGNNENSEAIIIQEDDLMDLSSTFLEKRMSDIGGMRHRSAARFAYDQPDSIVIVASQDGGLSLITQIADEGINPQVAVIRNWQHILWDMELTNPVASSE